VTRLRVLLVVATIAVLAFDRFGAQRAAATHGCVTKRLPPAAAAGELVQWGHVKSLQRNGARWLLRFDPAWWLSGVAAERAAVQDKVIRPGEAVPNDYYVVDETHRLLTYAVSGGARVSVLTGSTCATRIGVDELAAIVAGRNPRHRPLYDRGNHLGFWIVVGAKYPNAVRSLDQQYQP
jgi:hypothetical protein